MILKNTTIPIYVSEQNIQQRTSALENQMNLENDKRLKLLKTMKFQKNKIKE